MTKTNFSEIAIDDEQAAAYARDCFGLAGKIKALPGDVDFNFYLKTATEEEFTLKISRPNTERGEIEFQNDLMLHTQKQALPFAIPSPITDLAGNYISEKKDKNGNIRLVRLQSWIAGRPLGQVNPRTNELLYDWGHSVGLLSKALQDFKHPKAHRSLKWNPSETLQSKPLASYIQDQNRKEIAQYFWDFFEQNTLPQLPQLRKSINHNDAHEFNVLVSKDYKNPEVRGIIDFGDAIYTETINELAITCAYAGMDFPDPLSAICEIVRGYHAAFPIEEKELEVLYSMITARLLITVANAALGRHNEPENTYLQISENQAWQVLTQLRKIHPNYAHYAFRQACGLTPCPLSIHFTKWWKQQKNEFTFPISIKEKTVTSLDLSTGSLLLGNNENFTSARAFHKIIQRHLEDKEADFGIGGYAEVRPVYTTDAYQVMGNAGPQWRSVHLGTDIWGAAGTPVYAAFAGRVHSFQDNNIERDYGPTIILEHRISEELTFYTLYGHLNRESLKQLKVGDEIQTGQQIAELGNLNENGNWPPHLHFQLILDLLGNEGNYPGVAFPNEADIWLNLCPNILEEKKISPVQSNQNSRAEIFQKRQKNLGKSLSLSYQNPLHMVRGFGQYLYDTTGRRYLDTCNNVAHVGHQHPRVVAAIQQQAAVLNTNTRYLHENITRFAEELAATFPEELSVVYFVNSGSEANELALRMARTYTQQKDMIAVEVGYHGNTGGTIDISSYKFDGKGGQGAPPHTHIVPMPDTYRGRIRELKNAGEKYAHFVKDAIKKVQAEGRNISGFICESILSCGGQIVLPPKYLVTAYEYIRAAGGLCIADEVQVGFGRVGSHFWGFELQGVVPDIVTMGKPIGNGHPLAAVITTPAVAAAFTNGMEYFNTFGGNPVSCAVGYEVLQIIKDEQLQSKAQKTGDYLQNGLKSLQAKYPIIGDIRGHGLFLGFEMVKNRESKDPAAAQASYFANRMRELGILISTDGPDYNVIKIKPPMCFSESDADFLLEMTDKVLAEDFMQIPT